MSSPKISIIIPVFNSQKTIKQCLDSVFSQTFKDFEVILVNDGSTDGTMGVVEGFSASFPLRQRRGVEAKREYNCLYSSRRNGRNDAPIGVGAVKPRTEGEVIGTVTSPPPPLQFRRGESVLIINQKNFGAAAARNRGAKEARGEFLIFWDADVIGKPQMLEKMYQTLKNNLPAAYVYSSFKYGFKIFKLWPFTVERLKRIPYIHTTSLIKRLYFPGFDENLKRFQDWDLWLTIAENGGKGIWIPEVLFKILAGGKMSYWLPKWSYKIPWLKRIKEYKKAVEIVKRKHGLE